MSKQKKRKRLRKKAARLPDFLQDIAFAKTGKTKTPGTFGPASPVRHIDPQDYSDRAQSPLSGSAAEPGIPSRPAVPD